MSFYPEQGPVSLILVRERAMILFKAFVWFSILKSKDPGQQKLLDRLMELRLEIQGVLNLLAPGWEK